MSCYSLIVNCTQTSAQWARSSASNGDVMAAAPLNIKRKPDLSKAEVRRKLSQRSYPYWQALAFGRFLGYSHRPQAEAFWLARYRRKNGEYHQRRLGKPDDRTRRDGDKILSHRQALDRAWKWLATVSSDASDPNPLRGKNRDLLYCPIGDVFTLGHALKEYLEWKRLASAETHFDVIVSMINHHILPRLGPMPLDELQSEHFRTYFLEVLETPPQRGNRPPGERRPLATFDSEAIRKRKKTVNVLMSILRDTLRLAWENSKTDNDRLWRSLRSFPNVDRPRMLHLSRSECRLLLRNCRVDLRPLVLGALYTGCRSLELLRMQVCDVGKDGYGVYVLPSKTHKSRFVFLPDEGMAFFLKLAKGKPAHQLLFTRLDGTRWGEYYRKLFKDAGSAAGLPKEFCFHGLRHTYASQLVQAGAPLIVVADQLGHANSVTVSRTYGHVSPQIREAEVRQRFTVLSPQNSKSALAQKKMLTRWRKSFHGSDWRGYAKIHDLSGRARTTS